MMALYAVLFQPMPVVCFLPLPVAANVWFGDFAD